MAVIEGDSWLFGLKCECLKGLLVLGKNTHSNLKGADCRKSAREENKGGTFPALYWEMPSWQLIT